MGKMYDASRAGVNKALSTRSASSSKAYSTGLSLKEKFCSEEIGPMLSKHSKHSTL